MRRIIAVIGLEGVGGQGPLEGLGLIVETATLVLQGGHVPEDVLASVRDMLCTIAPILVSHALLWTTIGITLPLLQLEPPLRLRLKILLLLLFLLTRLPPLLK